MTSHLQLSQRSMDGVVDNDGGPEKAGLSSRVVFARMLARRILKPTVMRSSAVAAGSKMNNLSTWCLLCWPVVAVVIVSLQWSWCGAFGCLVVAVVVVAVLAEAVMVVVPGALMTFNWREGCFCASCCRCC